MLCLINFTPNKSQCANSYPNSDIIYACSFLELEVQEQEKRDDYLLLSFILSRYKCLRAFCYTPGDRSRCRSRMITSGAETMASFAQTISSEIIGSPVFSAFDKVT